MERRYITVYSWQVLSTLKEDKEIFCHDRGIQEVLYVSTMPVKSLMLILAESEKTENYGRYEFYYIEKVEEGADDDNI